MSNRRLFWILMELAGVPPRSAIILLHAPVWGFLAQDADVQLRWIERAIHQI